MPRFLFLLMATFGFFACKRSISRQPQDEYDVHFVHTLKKLEQHYVNKKVRINTWDKQADAYQDIEVLNDDKQVAGRLTIGDSVKFIAIDLSQPDGIRAEIKLNNNHTGYIPYFKIEEFEPAAQIDPDLKD